MLFCFDFGDQFFAKEIGSRGFAKVAGEGGIALRDRASELEQWHKKLWSHDHSSYPGILRVICLPFNITPGKCSVLSQLTWM